MSYTVQFQFLVTVGGDIDEEKALKSAIGVAKSTFGEILYQEFTDPEAFLD